MYNLGRGREENWRAVRRNGTLGTIGGSGVGRKRTGEKKTNIDI